MFAPPKRLSSAPAFIPSPLFSECRGIDVHAELGTVKKAPPISHFSASYFEHWWWSCEFRMCHLVYHFQEHRQVSKYGSSMLCWIPFVSFNVDQEELWATQHFWTPDPQKGHWANTGLEAICRMESDTFLAWADMGSEIQFYFSCFASLSNRYQM